MDNDKEIVHAACKRGRDAATKGQSCGSTSAFKMNNGEGGNTILKCAQCEYTWIISVGGTFTAC